MTEERKSSFFVVFDWMLTDLRLSGYQAFIYAAIYNYSQDPSGCFSGSISYLQKALGASRNAVISALAELTKKGLIAKKETLINGVKFNTYRATVRNCTGSAETDSAETAPPVQKMIKPGAETEPGGSAVSAPNNIYNKKNNNKGNTSPYPLNGTENIASPVSVSPSPGSRKDGTNPRALGTNPRALSEKFDPLAYLTAKGVDAEVAQDWLAMRKAKKAQPTKTAIDGIAGEAAKAGISLEDALKISCANGWQGFRADWITQRRNGKSPVNCYDHNMAVVKNFAKTLRGENHG